MQISGTLCQSTQNLKMRFSKKKPVRVLFTVECTEDWWQIKVMLSHLEQYKEELAHCSKNIIHLIKTAYDCHNCNDHCKGPAPFTLDGKEYRKCLGCNFYFVDLDSKEQSSLLHLLTKEAAY